MQTTFLTAEWENLIMVNYIIEPAVLSAYIPNKTQLDFFKGNTYVSLVGFNFTNTKLAGIKIPFHSNFEEVNLRFYVQHLDKVVLKRGVVFIKEIVPKPAISFVANTFYHEKYCSLPMKHLNKEKENSLNLGYYWKHKNKWNKLEAAVDKEPVEIITGSEEEFIAEHYWGYSKHNETTYEYQVQHPKWQIYPLKEYTVGCDFAALYGNSFAFLQNLKPASVFVAKGSRVSVLSKLKL